MGGNGADLLIGGTGDDTLKGGNGSDEYRWAPGDGNDILHDEGTARNEEDRLVLTGVAPTDVTLVRGGASDNGIIVRINDGGVERTIELRHMLQDPASGVGIEALVFVHGGTTTTWSRAEILRKVTTTGTSGNDSRTGLGGPDHLIGLAGNDSLSGADGDDILDGGTGIDTLVGGNGSDRYIWAKGDGVSTTLVDLINDAGTSPTEIDELVLVDAVPADVALSRNGNNLWIDVQTSGGVQRIAVQNQFTSAENGVGIERIVFADGSVWSADEIVSCTVFAGTASAEGLTGTTDRDFITGLGGNDTITGGTGDDTIIGGAGADFLAGGAGSDRYEWRIGDGNDTINDSVAGGIDIDVLHLVDVARAPRP